VADLKGRFPEGGRIPLKSQPEARNFLYFSFPYPGRRFNCRRLCQHIHFIMWSKVISASRGGSLRAERSLLVASAAGIGCSTLEIIHMLTIAVVNMLPSSSPSGDRIIPGSMRVGPYGPLPTGPAHPEILGPGPAATGGLARALRLAGRPPVGAGPASQDAAILCSTAVQFLPRILTLRNCSTLESTCAQPRNAMPGRVCHFRRATALSGITAGLPGERVRGHGKYF
jgi:hypothetical protein